jgi:mono/diheme cytochrome c family protein
MLVRFLFLALTATSIAQQASMPPDAAGYTQVAAPFLTDYCVSCHGPEKQKGEFRVDKQLANNFLDRATKEKWAEVVNALNGHEMPPEDEKKQPKPQETARFVDWVTKEMVRAELVKRDTAILLRRLNRDEYKNTIRDLCGVDFDVSALPSDPPAGGFDNNGRALTMSPMHLELYVELAQKILDRALLTGPQPEAIKWRFEPEVGDGDSSRVRLDKKNNPIVHGGKNENRDGVTVMHHASWDRNPNARDFRLPAEGDYIIRVHAGGRIPGRDAVVASARAALEDRAAKSKNEKEAARMRERLDKELEHFQNDRMYDYGPPRLKLVLTLGGQPRPITEWDVDAPVDQPKTYEFRVRCTTESAGITLEYAYTIPKVLENFWMQGSDKFARPEAYLDWFEIEGPFVASWPPPSHKLILGETEPKDERISAREVIAKFMRRAFRRPVAAAEVEAKLALFDAARKLKPGYVEAIKVPLIAVLASPHFLYMAEPAGAGDGKALRALNDHELAARLSYFLWSTMPDAELSALADAGKLRDPKILIAQTDRLLRDPKHEAFVKNFAGQWLGLREVGANPPAEDLYPQYDRHLETSFIGEAQAFFSEILRHDLSALNFIKSDFVTINERLARFYGIDGVRGDAMRRVTATAHRGGIVTQGAMLTITSNGTRTSPVKRGTWLLKNLLGTDPGLPVANVGEIAPKVPGIDKATVRQRLAIHRELAQCARCHDKIDPLGFALENFNAAGEWREQEGFGYKGRIERNDPKIDASAKLPDGTEINGADSLREALLKKEDLFLNCLANKLFTYALGRELGIADQPTIKAATAYMKQQKYTLRSLIHATVASQAFRTK